MVANFTGGGAAINQICKTFDISLKVYELALEQPTGDITREPAMDERDCAATMAFGMEALASQSGPAVPRRNGHRQHHVAAAIYYALYGGEPEDWVGRGTGVDDAGLKRKADAVRAALARHREHLGDPLEVLRRLGGREIAAMAGAILAARMQRMPVRARRLRRLRRRRRPARARSPRARPLPGRPCLGGATRTPRRCADIGKAPLLNLGMRLGEGSGAALAVGVLKAAVACHNGMATFAEAGVAGKE